MSRIADILVVGGGLHGLSAALQSARRGAKVTLLEADWIGRHASSATAGGVRTLNRDYREMPLAIESMRMWHEIDDLVGDGCGFHPGGQLSVAETGDGLARLQERARETRSRGYTNERMIDQDELRDLVPALSPHCLGAIYAEGDGAADPHRTLRAFRRACEEAGVRILEGTQVTGVARRSGDWELQTDSGHFHAPVVINAAGAWAASFAAMAGETIPLGHKASMMMVTERIEPLLRQVVGGFGRNLSFKQSDQGTLIIGGGLQGRADVANKRSWVDYEVLARSARTVTELFPCVADVRITRCWTGIEAKTSDLLPVIDRSEAGDGLWHAFGFSGHGFQLVPVVGSIMADLAIEGRTSRPIAPFASRRLREQAAA